MSPPVTATNHTLKLESLLNKFRKAIDHNKTLLSELTDLAPHMLAPYEWVKLHIPQKLIDLQTQLEYAVWHEQTGKQMTLPTKEEVVAMRTRHSKQNLQSLSSQLQTPHSERPDSQISDFQLESLKCVDAQLGNSRSVDRPPVFSTPQKQAAKWAPHSDIPETPGSDPVVSRRQHATILITDSNVQHVTKKAAKRLHIPPIVSNPNPPAQTKRRRQGSSQDSEDSEYCPDSAGSSQSVSVSPTASPAPTPSTAGRATPPAKRRALTKQPIRRPPSATPLPVSALTRQTPQTPLNIVIAKTNEELLDSFVHLSVIELTAMHLTDLQDTFKGIKVLKAYARNTTKDAMIDHFIRWQNDMLELGRGEVPQTQTGMPKRLVNAGIIARSDGDLLDGFVFKSVRELQSLKVRELELLVRGVEGLRQYFNGLDKKSLVEKYMGWQRKMVALKRQREEDEDADEEMEDAADEGEEENTALEDIKQETASEAVVPKTAPEVINLVSDSEDEDEDEKVGGAVNGARRVVSRKQGTRMVEV
ncbi:hypothetical protein E2P81_ATG03143 [Venturia nashicola]|nr:hypothetical protein E2P81_ATG03143 [Venturia nashicola]